MRSISTYVGRRLRRRHGVIVLVLAPPRAAGTVIARALWQHPDIGHYVHEPFDADYHLGHTAQGWAALERPLARTSPVSRLPKGLVVKEVTFQVAPRLSEFLTLPTHPVIFVIRDPRLSVSSRMHQRRRGGQNPSFPERETGWPDLLAAIELCIHHRLAHVIIDSTDIRRDPGAMLESLCTRIGLPSVGDLHHWERPEALELGKLGASQRHWYDHLLESRGIEAPTEHVPTVDQFADTGLRRAVKEAVEHYQHLRCAPSFLGPTRPTLTADGSR